MTSEFPWEWRQTLDLPQKVLAVYSRTEYNKEGWEEIVSMHDSMCNRALGDPNVLGLASLLDVQNHCTWGVSAWCDYDHLEGFVENQIQWLTGLVDQVLPKMVRRHNAYRFVSTADFPLDWDHVKQVVGEVQRVSPLGADCFPELSKALGIEPVKGC
jgi:hypothetical protein